MLRTAPGVAVLLLLAGCAGLDARVSSYGSYGNDGNRLELDAVPFYPQKRYQCGPAALTTLLTASGADAALDAVTDQVYLPGRRGSLQLELVAASRAHERIPYAIDGTLAGLIGELEAGRPVLVLQNLGPNWFPRWHYAVVVGIDPARDEVVLRSGTERRRITATRTFLRTWRRGGYWGFVALAPGELPATPDRERYVAAVAALEDTGNVEAAYTGWKAAAARWPADTTASFGLASAAYGLGRDAEAETLYRRLLERDPHLHAARNNLAYVLARQGRTGDALRELRTILEQLDDSDERRAIFEASLAEIGGGS